MAPILGIVMPLKLNEKTQRRLLHTLAVPMVINLLIIALSTLYYLINPMITPTANLLSTIPLLVPVVSFAFKFIANTIYALIGKYICEGTYPAIKKIHVLPQTAHVFLTMGMILEALMILNVIHLHQGNLRWSFSRMTCAVFLLEFVGNTLVLAPTIKLFRDVQVIRDGMTLLEIKYQETINYKKDVDYIYYVI